MASLLADGVNVFVELGPHPVLLPSIEQTAQARGPDGRDVACGRREESDRSRVMAAVGALWAAGLPDRLARSLPAGRDLVDLPLYPWQRERIWIRRGRRSAPLAVTAAVAPAR